MQLERCFNYARDATGRALLWIGRGRSVGSRRRRERTALRPRAPQRTALTAAKV